MWCIWGVETRKSFSIILYVTFLVLMANRVGFFLLNGRSDLVVFGDWIIFSEELFGDSSFGVINAELGSVWRCTFGFQTISFIPIKFYFFFGELIALNRGVCGLSILLNFLQESNNYTWASPYLFNFFCRYLTIYSCLKMISDGFSLSMSISKTAICKSDLTQSLLSFCVPTSYSWNWAIISVKFLVHFAILSYLCTKFDCF